MAVIDLRDPNRGAWQQALPQLLMSLMLKKMEHNMNMDLIDKQLEKEKIASQERARAEQVKAEEGRAYDIVKEGGVEVSPEEAAKLPPGEKIPVGQKTFKRPPASKPLVMTIEGKKFLADTDGRNVQIRSELKPVDEEKPDELVTKSINGKQFMVVQDANGKIKTIRQVTEPAGREPKEPNLPNSYDEYLLEQKDKGFAAHQEKKRSKQQTLIDALLGGALGGQGAPAPQTPPTADTTEDDLTDEDLKKLQELRNKRGM